MGWSTVGLVLVGILASASIIVAKKPNAKDLIDKLVPYQGWIGVVNFLWGVWFSIWLLMHMGTFVQHVPVRFAVWAANAAAMLLLGFLMGFGLISKFALSKNEAAMQKGQALRAKLAKVQGPLGLIGIAAGIAGFVFCFLTF